jgi:hypothetical protein
MFDEEDFLTRVLAKAGTKAAIARSLNLPSSRVAELYGNKRRLTMREGMALSEAFEVPLSQPISAEMLQVILAVFIRHEPREGWKESDAERLSHEIIYGIELIKSLQSSPPSRDALDLVSRVIADRLREINE